MSRSNGHGPEWLEEYAFDELSFPPGVRDCMQARYLRCYLSDLRAGCVVEEPHYFDRNYLAEFRAFYSTSARGYANSCRRLHLFTLDVQSTRTEFFKALGGNTEAAQRLQSHYLGFVIVRPTTATPFGRAVLRWYPERDSTYPRVVEPARCYWVHLAGIRLFVNGIAWQQQDNAVGACATVALWSLFHSSALDEHHAVPTTAEVTEAANRRWPLAKAPVYPAKDGLNIFQICEAVRAQNLRPMVLDGDIHALPFAAFSRDRFSSAVASLIRSGYPVLLGARAVDPDDIEQAADGDLRATPGHAVCVVGFRTPSQSNLEPGVAPEDRAIDFLYLHDDNLGPNVRFRITTRKVSGGDAVILTPDAPEHHHDLPDPAHGLYVLLPDSVVAALPEEIRVSSSRLHDTADAIGHAVATVLTGSGIDAAVTFSSRFFRLAEYLNAELPRRLGKARVLVKARLALSERVRPMSLHLGVVRIAVDGCPIADILFDTTDSESALLPFAHLVFQPPGKILQFFSSDIAGRGIVCC